MQPSCCISQQGDTVIYLPSLHNDRKSKLSQIWFPLRNEVTVMVIPQVSRLGSRQLKLGVTEHMHVNIEVLVGRLSCQGTVPICIHTSHSTSHILTSVLHFGKTAHAGPSILCWTVCLNVFPSSVLSLWIIGNLGK